MRMRLLVYMRETAMFLQQGACLPFHDHGNFCIYIKYLRESTLAYPWRHQQKDMPDMHLETNSPLLSAAASEAAR